MSMKKTEVPKFPDTFPVTCHTRHVGPCSVFVAIKGIREDGVNYIPEAIARGATEIVLAQEAQVPQEIADLMSAAPVTITRSANPRLCLALRSAQAAGCPAHKLHIIGITGTKGKTTTAYLLEHMLKEAGYKTALLTTVVNRINDALIPTSMTTPQPDYLHQFLKLCVQESIDYVIMEVSAQALTFNRIDGILFDGVVFTNFEQDHLDYYKTMENYFQAKCQIFSYRKQGALACLNTDDPWLTTLISSYAHVCTFGLSKPGMHVRAQLVGEQRDAVRFTLELGERHAQLECQGLMGRYNVYNCLASVTMALQLGVSLQAVISSLKTFSKVPGRLERYQLPNGAVGLVDYAHNPSSCEAVLSLLSTLTDHLIVVLGAGGERDRLKRPKMGAIAARYAQIFVLTSDNSRSENPEDIANDIMSGIAPDLHGKVVRELNREMAINRAYALSRPGSIIAILGRGPEEFLISSTGKIRLVDAEVVQSLI
jgi:UDP-N-acetylmuramoyl-L-alanyl-D-glutamate--2,6-diaminopimelate ligase